MKFKQRALALMLSMMMVLTFMPALAFADDDPADGNSQPAVEEVQEEAAPASPEAVSPDVPNDDGDDWDDDGDDWDDEDWDEDFYFDYDEDERDFPVYSDGTKTIDFYPEGGDGYTIKAKVGILDKEFVEDLDDEKWDSWSAEDGLLEEGKDKDYYYNTSKDRLYLYGPKIFEKLNGVSDRIFVTVAFVNDEGKCVYWDGFDLGVKEATIEAWLSFRGGEGLDELQLFPGEADKLYKACEGWAENTKYPDGDWFDDFTLTSVKSSDTAICTVTPVENSKGKVTSWKIKGIKVGDAELLITYSGAGQTGQKMTLPVKVTEDKIYASMDYEGRDSLLPGESMEFYVEAGYESYEYGYDTRNFTYDWWIAEEDKDKAEVAADPDDPSRATVTVKNFDLEDEAEVEVGVTVSYKDIVSKDVTNSLMVRANMTRLVLYDTEGNPIDGLGTNGGNIDIGSSVTFTPKVVMGEYDNENHETVYEVKEDVRFEWDGYSKTEKNAITLTDNKDGSYTFKRLTGGDVDIDLYSYWTEMYNEGDDEDPDWYEEEVEGPSYYFWFKEIQTDLSCYYVELVDCPESYYGQSYYIDPSNEGVTPEVRVVDWDGYVLPESEYTIVVKKWNTKKEKYVTSSMPLKFDTNKTDPYWDGRAAYTIIAKPKTKRFTGESDDAYVEVFSEKTLVYGAGMAKLAEPFEQYKNSKSEWDWRYNLPAGVQLTDSDLEVYGCYGVEGKEVKLTKDTDYTVMYENWITNKTSEEVPTSTGAYTVIVQGTGEYSGMNSETSIFIGKKNPMKIKNSTKSVKLAKVKKKKQVVAPLKVTKAKGKVRYEKWGGSAKLTVNKKTGKVTVKKGAKKGVYYIWVAVTAAGNDTYAPERQVVLVTVKVKK